MIRMLIGVVIGAALTILLVSGNVTPRSVNAQDVAPTLNTTENDLVGSVRQAMILPLLKTINETSATGSGQFLQKLVDAYGLDNMTQADQPGAGLVAIVPDFKTINEKAITLPLAEAGKNIQDPEIAAFYYDYLQRSGFNISPKNGAKP